MPKRKKARAAKKAKRNAPDPDEAPSPAKKMATVSSTSQLEEVQVSSCTSLPVDAGIELQSETPLSPSCLSCTCCNFSASTRSILDDHMQQHKLSCPWCPFSSLTYLEVIHHCKFKHDKSTEIDTIPCHACVYCSFMTYIPEHLENHTALKHPDEPSKFIPKIISKQASAGVRRDDAVYCQTLTNNTARSFFMKIEAGSHSGGKSNPIVIDAAATEVSKDIKHEANSGSVSETCVKMADPSVGAISKQVLINYLLTDVAASEELKAESGSFETKCEVRAAEASHLEVKLERLYCLTCPFSSISIDEIKCHTVGQHPVGAAAATYNVNGESASMDDTSFFCVRQSCTFSSFDYTSYQRHLVDCCAFQKALSVLERTRLKTTIVHILDCQRKYTLKLEDVFLNFALSCLGNHSEANQAVASTSSNLGSQTCLPPMSKNVNKPPIASLDHCSLPGTTFIQTRAHNQQTSSAGMSSSYTQQGNIETPYSSSLGSTQQLQSNNQSASNGHTTGHMLEDAMGQDVNTFSFGSVPSVHPHNSSSIPSNLPLNSRNLPSNVSFHSSSASLNVPVNSNSLPSNVAIISTNALSNIPVNSSSERSLVPGNRNLLQPHQFPVNNTSNFLLHQTGNEKQQQASFSTGPINQDANAHNFLLGSDSVFLASQHQPGALVNSGQCQVEIGSMSAASLASNSAAHIHPGTASIQHNHSLSTNQVSHTGQQHPGVLINSGQSHCATNWHQQNSLASNSAMHTNMRILVGTDNKPLISHSNSSKAQAYSANQTAADQGHFKMGSPHLTSQQSSSWIAEGTVFSNGVTPKNQGVSGNVNYASTAGRPNNVAGMSQTKAGSFYQNLSVSQSNMTSDRMVNGQQCGVFTTAANVNQFTASNVKHSFPARQLNAIRDSNVLGQKSGNLMTVGNNQGTTGNINHTLPASQCNNIEGRTVFGQQSGSLMTAGNNHGGPHHNSSDYNTIAGRATGVQTGQSGILTNTGLKQGPPGNLAYTTQANRPATSLNYGLQPGNITAARFNHGTTGNQNQTSCKIDPMISQESCQIQADVNQTGLGISAQHDTSDSNTILVFDMSASKSRLHELTCGNQQQLPPGTFYQAASLGTQNQAMVRPIHFVESVGQPGKDSQPGTPKLESTMRCSADNNSRSQVSCSSFGQSGYFTSESVSSYFGSQTADGAGNNRTIYSGLPEQLSGAQGMLSVSNTSCTPSFETGSAHPSHLNQCTRALRSVSVHTGPRMTTTPQQANPVLPVVISSLPPSIHRQQNAAVGRTFMGPRGAALSGACPRSSPTSVAPQRHQRGAMRQRPVGRGRGQATSPRMLPGSIGAQHNTVLCGDDDDDVIMTSGFPIEDTRRQNRPSGCKLPIAQPQRMPSANSHHDSKMSKVHAAVRSSQSPRCQQSKKHVDVGGHFENLVCAMNASTSADIINVAPEDDVEILSVVVGETRSGTTQGLEVSQKTRPVENLVTARGQNNSVNWNLKDNFSHGLSDVYSDILNSSLRLPCKPPSVSQPSVRHAVPPRKEATQANISANQQTLVRPAAYSEQKDVASKGSTPCNASPRGTPIRAGLRQISPAGLSSSVPGRRQIQQRPPQTAQLHKITPSKAPTSTIASSSNPPVHSQQQPSVIILDADGPTPSRQANKNSSVNKDSHQEVIFVELEPKSMNKEPAQDVIILDADPSEHPQQTEINNPKTAKPPEYLIILDGDSSENLIEKEKNVSAGNEQAQAVANRKLTRPAFSVPSTRGNRTIRPQSVGHNMGNKRIYTPRAQLVQPFSPAHQGAPLNSRVRPQLRQHFFAGSNGLSPATRSAVRAPRAVSFSPVSRGARVQNINVSQTATDLSASEFSNSSALSTNVPAASVSPVSVNHPNHYPNSTVTQTGPRPTPRGTSVQNRNLPQAVTNISASEFSNSPIISTNVPAVSVSPVSVSHAKYYPNSSVAQRGPQPASRSNSVQNRNEPQVASEFTNSSAISTNVPAALVSPASASHPNHYPGNSATQKEPQFQSQPPYRGTYFQVKSEPQTNTAELSNSSVVSTDVPITSAKLFITGSEATSGCSEKTGVPEIQGEATHLVPSLPEKSQLATDSTGKERDTSVADHMELLNSKMNQSKVAKNLPALVLAKFKKCANLKCNNSVAQQAVVNKTAGACSQRTFLDDDAKGANPTPGVFSSQSSECSNKAGKVVTTPPSLQPLLKLSASLSSVLESSTVQEVADLDASNASLLSAIDSDKIIIYDLDVNKKQPTLSLSSEDMIIIYSDVNEQQQDSVLAVQNPLVDQQTVTLNTSSDQEIIKRSSQFSTVRDTRLLVTSTPNSDLSNSVSEAEKSTPTAVSERHLTDVDNCQSGHTQTVEIKKPSSYLHNQETAFPGAHNQLKDPPVLYNHLKDSPLVPNQLKDPPVLYNQLKASPDFHSKLKDSPLVPNQLKDPPVLQNQLKASPVFHSKLKDSPVFHSQLQGSPELHNRLRYSPSVANQQEDSRSVPGATFLPSDTEPQAVSPQFQVANNIEPSPSSNLREVHADDETIPSAGPTKNTSQVFTKGRGKSRKGLKRNEVDEPGEIFLETTEKQIPKKTVVVNESENKESVIEKSVVRHSDRLLKSALKDFTISGSDTEVHLSDGSEFCIGEEDINSDTDSDWSDGQEKNSKAKSKRIDTFQDPAAFDIKIKGNFKCWICRKIYSRCTFAKDHIVKKHFAGLCVLDLDRSRETNSVCLLVFCPRVCKYASNTLAGINGHMKTCSKLVLIHKEYNFIEINRDFLEQKYDELMNLPLERVLCPVRVRKPKDPTKPPKAKKPKSSLSAEKVSRPSCGAPHTTLPFPNTPGASPVPVAPLGHTVADRTFVSGASQSSPSFQAHNMQPPQLNQGQGHTGHSASPTAVRGQVSRQQRSNHYGVNSSQMPMQLPVTLVPSTAFSKDVPSSVNFQNAHQRSLAFVQSPEQQLNSSNVSAPSNISASHHRSESYRTDPSTELEDIYVVEDNDIICLE